jgi:hypothetical protein
LGVTERRYYSERHGRGPRVKPHSFDRLRTLAFSVLDEFDVKCYFQEAFGYACVDAGEVDGRIVNPAAYFQRTVDRDDIWPYRSSSGITDGDALFDLLEVLHDLISKPLTGQYHDWNDCGWHYETFDQSEGQAEYRAELNRILARYEPPLEMNPQGEIVQKIAEGFAQLLQADTPPDTEPAVEQRMRAAIQLFRSRDVTVDDLRRAVRDLGDVLELIRSDVQDVMLSRDEADLFSIANNFSIRHHNDRQRTDYEAPVWLRWLFYHYLSTIHLVLRLRERRAEGDVG